MSLLRDLVETARETIESGYYRGRNDQFRYAPSLVKAINQAKAKSGLGLIAEIKPATPTRGKLVEGGHEALMKTYLAQGACALSVVTEPRRFHGTLQLLRQGVATGAPTLMKDFILDEGQIDCAAANGASAILLIVGLLPKNRIPTLIDYAHVADREVVLECGSRAEVELALESEADILGVNNRDLSNFRVDLERTPTFLQDIDLDRPTIAMSGYATRAEVDRVRGLVDAVLVGSSLLEGKATVKGLIGP